MTDNTPLTALQLSVLRVLWETGEVSVSEVAARLEAERPLAFTTVATLLSRLEKRGVVTRRRKGRQFLYTAAIDREDTRTSRVNELARDLFEGDVSNLVHHLLSSKEIQSGDLARVKALIEAREAEGQNGGAK